MADAVLQYAGAAKTFGKRYGIPPAILLGLIKVESGGNHTTGGALTTSSANAKGLTQFEPATRAEILKKYGVDAYASGTDAVHAAALYLRDLGYKSNPDLALAKYNGGSNPPASSFAYARTVKAAGAVYANTSAIKGSGVTAGGVWQDATGFGAPLDALGIHPFGKGPAGELAGGATSAVTGAAAGVAGDVISGVVDALGINGAKIGVTVGLVVGGAVLAVMGVARTTGLKPATVVEKVAKGAAVAA